jgi:hypothetical protein
MASGMKRASGGAAAFMAAFFAAPFQLFLLAI